MIILTILFLAVMEVSLSFDNAVVNATVLRNMSAEWQRRFLTWGIFIAVVGMRLVLPVLIVSVAGGMGVAEVARMAISDPEEYGRQLASSHVAIASFGGIFLLMVFLGFILDAGKETHWIAPLERHLTMVGRIEASAIAIALAVILCLPAASLVPGMLGLLCYLFVNGLMGVCGDDPTACVSGKKGLAAFIYLEVLDASFSLDGVVGAFAMSDNILVIMIGLGIGAAVIRTLTVRLVRGGTLSEFIYLEHGAHYGIGALAVLMLVSTVHHVSEIVTGLAGVGFILLALASSVIHNRKELAQ